MGQRGQWLLDARQKSASCVVLVFLSGAICIVHRLFKHCSFLQAAPFYQFPAGERRLAARCQGTFGYFASLGRLDFSEQQGKTLIFY